MATIHTLNSHPSGDEQFSFEIVEEETAVASYNTPKRYLYEPNAAVMKSGAFQLISEQFKLDKLDDTHAFIYVASEKIADFPGKIYAISNSYRLSKEAFKKSYWRSKSQCKNSEFF